MSIRSKSATLQASPSGCRRALPVLATPASRARRVVAAIAASALAVPAFATPAERPRPQEIQQMSADQLKLGYLACDRDAARRLLDIGEAERCGQLYVELKERVFAGDFEAMLAWWRAQRQLADNTDRRPAAARAVAH